MTDRLKGCILTFEHDIREDDVKPLIRALGMIRGVATVSALQTDVNDLMARERVRSEVEERMYEAIRKVFRP